MEFKGTKGEWLILKQHSSHKINEIATNENLSICAINTNLEQSEANAKLIACAPEMLEMLKDILDTIRECETPRLYQIEELIKKATE
jgi:hypothetical protein